MILNNSDNVSKELKYHLDNDISISQNIFRYGSSSWAKLIEECRYQYELGNVLEVNEDEYYMLETDIGKSADYEGNKVLLNTPEQLWDQQDLMVVYINSNNTITKIIFENSNKA